MDFDLLSSSPEAQLELMNTMLQLEQLTSLGDYAPAAPAKPASQVEAPQYFSPVPHVPGADSSYHEQCYVPAAYAAAPAGGVGGGGDGAVGSAAAMREMIFHMAALQPVNIDPEMVRPPKRRNVRVSKDPQSVAARMRRERISERIRILQRLVPGGTKMDTASMLDEAIHYVKFLKTQVQSLERAAAASGHRAAGLGAAAAAYPGLHAPW